MMKFFGVTQDTAGNAISSVSVRVNLAGTSTFATIFSDNSFTVLANPFTSDADGTYQFYAGSGRYDVVLTKTGFTFPAVDSSDILLLDVSAIITPAQIVADQNDYGPPNGLNAAVWRISSDASRTITGIAAGKSGQSIRVANIGSFPVILANQSASSVAANRIITGNGASLIIYPSTIADLVYDDVTARWRVAAGSALATTVLDRDVVTADVVNTTVETVVYSFLVPAGILGTNRALRLTLIGDYLSVLGRSLTLRIKYGGTTFFASNFGGLVITANAARRTLSAWFVLSAANATNAQVSVGEWRIGPENSADGDAIGSSTNGNHIQQSVGHNAGAVDSTIAQTLEVTFQHPAADLDTSARALAVQLELI